MNTIAEPFVSIVTPVYNGEKFLEECIESVLSQSYQNWEYIIVNNCSRDRSLEIARRLTEHDKRVHIHDNTEFLSSIQNFNHSLRLISSKSKYCKIVHADDWIFPECVTQMVKVAEEYPTIGVVGSYRLDGTSQEGTIVLSTGLPYKKTFIPGPESAQMNLLDGPFTIGTPSGLLIRSDLIRSKEKFYSELEFHQCVDADVYYALMQESDFGFVHQVLSFSRRHEGSITSSYGRFNAMLPSLFYCFIIYGPHFLSDAEFNTEKRKKLNDYYLFLGSRVANATDREFWSFHKQWLEKLGFRLNWSRIIWSVMFLFCIKAIDLKQHVRFLTKIFRR